MRQLGIFDTIRVADPQELRSIDIKNIKYGGFLTLSQSGAGKPLTKALKLAYENNLTCFNIVNVEDSPITHVIDDIIAEAAKAKCEKPVVLYNASDSEPESRGEEEIADKNIGLYQKSGHCYSDVKSFIP